MPEPIPPSHRETFGVVIALVAFVGLNLLTASRYPFVWIDEVMYSDPAFNRLLGHGFTSTAWYAQTANEFWAGNVPLPAILLMAWLKIFGLSLVAVRSLNYFYMVAACLLLWRGSARLGLIAVPRHRLLLLALLLTGYSLIFSYRSGRPDCIGLLAIAALLYACSLSPKWLALLFLFLLGAAAPWTGLQLLPLLAVGGGGLVLFAGRPVIPTVLACGLGTLSGGVALVAFYQTQGVWAAFCRSVGQHTERGFFGWLLAGDFRHSNLLPKDFSLVPLFLLAALLFFWEWRRERSRWRTPLGFGLLFSVSLTLTLLATGKFPTYYGWMVFAPLSVCVCAGLPKSRLAPLRRRMVAGLLIATLLVGPALHSATAIYDWNDRDPQRVEQLVHEAVTPTDWVYCDFGAYYAAKARAAQVFVPTYLAAIQPDERSRITVLIIHPRNLAVVAGKIGGNWVATGAELVPARSGLFGNEWRAGFLGMQNYRLTVYRRAP